MCTGWKSKVEMEGVFEMTLLEASRGCVGVEGVGVGVPVPLKIIDIFPCCPRSKA